MRSTEVHRWHSFAVLPHLVVATAILLFSTSAKGNFKGGPLLSFDPAFELPVAKQELFLDPILRSKIPNSPKEAESLTGRLSRLEKRLKRSETKAKAEASRRLLLGSAALAVHQARRAASGKASGRLSETRQQIIYAAEQNRKLADDPAQKARAIYHSYVAKYLSGAFFPYNMKPLRVSLERLPPALTHRAKVLLAFHDVTSDEKKRQTRAQKQAVQATRNLSAAEAASVHLTLAQAFSNVSPDGDAVENPDPRYINHLKAATDLSSKLSRKQRRLVLRSNLFLWTSAQRRPTWTKVPFSLRPFKDLKLTRAVLERQALTAAEAKNFNSALTIYESLVDNVKKQGQRPRFHRRILKLHALLYQKSGNPRPYEKKLSTLVSEYGGPQGKDEKAKDSTAQFRRQLLADYHSLARIESEKALRKNAKPSSQAFALRLLKSVGQYSPKSIKRKKIDLRIARLLERMGKHAAAAERFRRVAETAQNPQEKKEHFDAAISALQSSVNWPKKDPLNLLDPKNPKTLPPRPSKKLLDVYDAREKLGKGPPPWSVSAGHGTILMLKEQTKAAFKTWRKAVDSHGFQGYGKKVASYMLMRFRRDEKWEHLQDLAEQSLKENAKLTWEKKPLPVRNMLGEGLLKGGTQDLKKGRFTEAFDQLKKYVRLFESEPQHPKAYYLKILARRRMSDKIKSLEDAEKLAKLHPKSPYTKKALKDCIDLAQKMAMETKSIALNKMFVKLFPNDSFAAKAKRDIARISYALGRTKTAVTLYRDLLEDKNLSADAKNSVGQRLITIMENHASAEATHRATKHFAEHAPKSSRAKSLELLHRARKLVKQGNYGDLKEVVNEGEKLGAAARESLNEIRYHQATHQSLLLRNALDSPPLKQPIAGLKGHRKRFNTIKKAFSECCNGRDAEHCIKGKLALHNLAASFERAYASHDIGARLSAEKANRYEAERRKVLDQMNSIQRTSVEEAVSLVKKRTVTPSLAGRVLSMSPKGMPVAIEEGRPRLFLQETYEPQQNRDEDDESAELARQ